jgi:alkyl hydroperoxide reductase subunit AhpF
MTGGRSMLSEADRARVRDMLAVVSTPVRLVFFTQTFGCELCPDTRRILDEIASLQPLVTVDEVNVVIDRGRAEAFGITAAPSVVITGTDPDGAEWNPGVRFVGAPLGYEFTSLLDAITLVATRESGLSDSSRDLLRTVTTPMHVQVFSTPT